MPANSTIAKKAYGTGQYYLLDIDAVLEIYKTAGYDIENEDEEVPNVLNVEGEDCFFTGDLVKRDDKYYEIVIAAAGFKWEEVETDDDEDDEFDDEE